MKKVLLDKETYLVLKIFENIYFVSNNNFNRNHSAGRKTSISLADFKWIIALQIRFTFSSKNQIAGTVKSVN